MDESKRGSDLWNLSLEEICRRPYEDTRGAFFGSERDSLYRGRYPVYGKRKNHLCNCHALAPKWNACDTLNGKDGKAGRAGFDEFSWLNQRNKGTWRGKRDGCLASKRGRAICGMRALRGISGGGVCKRPLMKKYF